MVETEFLSCGNCFLLFNLFFFKWKLTLELVETNLFRKGIFSPVKTVFFYPVLFFFFNFSIGVIVIRAIGIYLLLLSYRSKPFAAGKRQRKKPALNSPAKRGLKNCWKHATLLKMIFIIGIFQGLWLQRSEHLFLGIYFSGCFRIFVKAVCQVHYKNPVM